MAKNPSLLLDNIAIDDALQARGKIDVNHVEDIAEAIKAKVKIKPPRVIRIDDPADKKRHGAFFAIDQHRVEAYRMAGKREVPVVLLTGTWADARDLATSANVEHTALKRTREAKENAVQMCWEDHPDWTPGRVADHCKVSASMAKEWMATVPKAAAVPQEKRVGLDGKKRRQRKATANGKPKKELSPADRFQPILSALTNVTKQINEAMNGEGGEKLLAYLTYYKLVKHPGAGTVVDGDTVTPEPKFTSFPILAYIVRAAAEPGEVLSHEDLKQRIEGWQQEKKDKAKEFFNRR